MVMVAINGVERYIDGYLKENLDALKKFVELKWDGVVYFGGYEGDGKTTLAMQSAAYLDPSFCLDRVCFTPSQFMEAVDKASVGQAIVYDEAQDAFDSGNKDNTSKLMKSKLTRIRKKRLYIFIVAADFWRINKYLFIHRSRAFIRIYADGFERGRFAFYNRDRKHKLYIKGKKDENLEVVSPNFIGRFTAWNPLDEEAYEAKKDKATEEVGKDDEETKDKDLSPKAKARIIRSLFINQCISGNKLDACIKTAGLSKTSYYRYLKEGVLEPENEVSPKEKPVFRVPVPPTHNSNNLSGEATAVFGVEGDNDN